MKYCPKLLLTIGAILSVLAAATMEVSGSSTRPATTTATATDSTRTRRRRRRLDDENWSVGTKVYYEFPSDGWWSGTITGYNDQTKMYTITWEDGSTDYFDDAEKVDAMVAYARNDPQNNPAGAAAPANTTPGTFPVGTPVSMYEGGVWYDGAIVNFDGSTGSNASTSTGIYSVQWAGSGEVEQIGAGAVMDQMVSDANKDDDGPPAAYTEGKPSSSEEPSPIPTDGASSSSEGVSPSSIPIGTPVSYYERGKWIDGTITGYFDGEYIVMWQDGSTDKYDDFGADLKELEKATEDAKDNHNSPPATTTTTGGNPSAPVPVNAPQLTVGTPVSDYSMDRWIDGAIIGFQKGNYIVRWDDEAQPEYYASSNAEDMQELNKMAADALGDDDAPPAGYTPDQEVWENGTRVAFLEDEIWYMGTITGFARNEYRIKWDDGEIEIEDDLDLLAQMVADGASRNPKGQVKGQKYDIGQLVYAEFNEGEWYVGRIILYGDDGFYTVRWSDGDHDMYKEKDLKSMVKAARYVPDNDDSIIDGPGRIGMSTAGIALLSLFLVAICIGFGFKFYEKWQIRDEREKELALEGDASASYRDEPSELPKII